ncbi:MAG: thiol peroxidase [Acidobacteria bacterium]|nr:thiol peroxidase [Acidobacteriota bacterium]
MAGERQGAVTMRGNPLTLLGNEVKEGQPAPDFSVLGNDMTPVTLADTSGIRVFLTVPSLDTGVCDAEVRRFNEEAAGLDNVTVYAISADLPFAQKRWCGNAGIDRVITLSDHRDMFFARAYGVQIKELRLLARAVFVVDANNKVVYTQLVPEIAQLPDYDAVLAAVRRLQ